ETGGLGDVRPLSGYASFTGLSDGCPLLLDQTRGARRSCPSCDGPLFAAGASGGILSADGHGFATEDGFETGGATLWQLDPVPVSLRSYPPRSDEAPWNPHEYPVAVGNGGRLVISGAGTATSCY